jgi:hypothetical protein
MPARHKGVICRPICIQGLNAAPMRRFKARVYFNAWDGGHAAPGPLLGTRAEVALAMWWGLTSCRHTGAMLCCHTFGSALASSRC